MTAVSEGNQPTYNYGATLQMYPSARFNLSKLRLTNNVPLNTVHSNSRIWLRPKKRFLPETYYAIDSRQSGELVPYSAAMALYTFFSDNIAGYAWNRKDVVILLLSRAIYWKFKSLHGPRGAAYYGVYIQRGAQW